MSITAAVAVPHPPLIFPEVGKGREQEIKKTVDAYHQAMDFVASFAPDTIVLISPHMRWYGDYFHVEQQAELTDNFEQFGAPEVRITVKADADFIKELNAACHEKGFPCGVLGEAECKIDHGSFIPLRFLSDVMPNYKVVRIAISGLPVYYHYVLGQILREVSDRSGRKTVLIASGDWSHKLKAEGPYGYAEEGPEFDKQIAHIFETADFEELLKMPPEFCEAAGECGYRPFVVLAGALDARNVASSLLAYEGPFGVGYGVATFVPQEMNSDRNFGTRYQQWRQQQLKEQLEREDIYVRLARYCVETFVLTGHPAELPPDLPAV